MRKVGVRPGETGVTKMHAAGQARLAVIDRAMARASLYARSMTRLNAFLFFCFGLLMWLLPVVFPGLFPRNAVDGASTRALWTQFMAIVQVALGVSFLMRSTIWSRRTNEASTEASATPERTAPATGNAVAALSEQAALFAARRLEADRMIPLRRQHAALWRALKVSFLDEERLVHFLQRLRLLAHRHRNGAHANGAAPVVVGHDAEHALVHFIKASGVNLEELERRSRDWLRDMTSRAFLREVSDEIDQIVGDARRAA